MSLSVKFHGQADAYRQICKAIEQDDGDKIAALIEAGAEPDTANEMGETLLHTAALAAKPAAVKALLEGGANVHAVDKEGHSVLRAAMRGGLASKRAKDEEKLALNLACVEAVIAAGADPYNFSYDPDDGRPNSDNMFSLNCDFDISRAVHRVADPFMINQTVNNKHYEDAGGLKKWLGLFEERKKVPVDTLDRYGKTALIHACEYGYAECAKVLLEHKADPNLPGRDGRLPIHALATGKNPAMVQQLVAAGAHLTAKDSDGKTALELAQHAGNVPMAAALQQALNDFTASATSAGEGLRAMRTLKLRQPVQS